MIIFGGGDDNNDGWFNFAWVLSDADGGEPEVVLIATGSEVQIAVAAQKALAEKDIPARVVSMPCLEWFESQSEEYRNKVLPPSVTARVAVEQASTFGWIHYAGNCGTVIGMKTFGASAPLKVLLTEFGFTKEHVVAAAKEQLQLARR